MRTAILDWLNTNGPAPASVVYREVRGRHSRVQETLRAMIADGTLQEIEGRRVQAAPTVSHPTPHRTAQELIQARRVEYSDQVVAHHAETRIQLPDSLPIAIWHCGDPHLDDPGTDLSLLERHVDIVRNTPGMYAGTVGDVTNNWVGRLARLYARQQTTAREAWTLAEWLFSACRWLYVCGGNHDAWSGDGDPLQWIVGRTLYHPMEARLRIGWHDSEIEPMRIVVRHSWPGQSQWNTFHGMIKAAQMGGRARGARLLVGGHTHCSGYAAIPRGGTAVHCLQVAAYKRADDYALERGFSDQTIAPCAVTLLDPQASHADSVRVYWDPAEAADALTDLRARRARR